MKKIIIASVLAIIGFAGFAQQLPQFSQYAFNNYIINPAVAGVENQFDVRLNQRYQWVGLTDAPRTFTFSVNGPLKNEKVGVGAYVFTDIVGPTRRTGIQGSYAYHLKLNDDIKLSLAASVGVLQYGVDGDQVTLKDEGDQAYFDGYQTTLMTDAKFGAHLYAENYYVGFAIPQLIGNKVVLFNENPTSFSYLERHYLAYGGYKHTFGDFAVEPSVLMKYVAGIPLKTDLTARVIYMENFWLGASYRTNDAVVAMAGFTYNDYLNFGYAYDITTTDLQSHVNGTHEFMVGIKFTK